LSNEELAEEDRAEKEVDGSEDSEPTPEDQESGEVALEPRLEDEFSRLTEELEEVRDLVRRKQAEFENYRKRVERERKDFLDHATSGLVTEILPVLDNLERALEAPDSGEEDRLREGVAITHRQFLDILVKAGLREVEALGRDFDPHVHEAVGRIETHEHRDGEVLEVYQKGYFFKGRLMRPALVAVVQRPQEQDDTEGTSDSSDEDKELQSDPTRS
jgi:molecular chaperone GrpE